MGETNLLHVPGLTSLDADQGVWVQKALTMFCPAAYSPSLSASRESAGGFMMLKHVGFCGERGDLLSTEAPTAEACSFLAQGAGVQSFLLGISFRRGYCYSGTLAFDAAQYESWGGERANPTCPGGDWTVSEIFDQYVLEPVSED